jgi:hypothetical protein
MRNKKYFFGWTNIKRGITELIKIYSHKPSSLSKKRIESGVAFIIAQWGMVFYLLKQYPNLNFHLKIFILKKFNIGPFVFLC